MPRDWTLDGGSQRFLCFACSLQHAKHILHCCWVKLVTHCLLVCICGHWHVRLTATLMWFSSHQQSWRELLPPSVWETFKTFFLTNENHHVNSAQVRSNSLHHVSTLTVQRHMVLLRFSCWTCVWLPGHQVCRKILSRNILLFQLSLLWGLHIPRWLLLKTAEKRKSGHCEFPQKHPCLSRAVQTLYKLLYCFTEVISSV